VSETSDDRQAANAALQAHFVPRLKEAGFSGSGLHFRRRKPDQIDLVTIQFDKWGGAFCIEVAVAPPNGVTFPWGKVVPPNKVTAHDIAPGVRIRLTPDEHLEDWWYRFAPDRTGLSNVVFGSPEKCARAAAQVVLTRGEVYFSCPNAGREKPS
jgi:hypothetical protein